MVYLPVNHELLLSHCAPVSHLLTQIELQTDVETDAVCVRAPWRVRERARARAQGQVHLRANLAVQCEQRVMHVKMFGTKKKQTPVPSRL